MGHNLGQALSQFPIYYIPFLFALCFHEFAHGWVARLKGDTTAQIMGRLTMNPLAHADPMGTFFLPAIGMIFGLPTLGWAKPVPVNERNLKKPLHDMFWIAAAGPLSNILLASIATFVFTFLYGGLDSQTLWGARFRDPIPEALKYFILINLILAFFNLVPAHPLDGAKILARFLPPRMNDMLENNQMISGVIIMVLALTGVLFFVLRPLVDLAFGAISQLAVLVLQR